MIALKWGTVEYVSDGAVTSFEDGTQFGALPHPDLPHYHVIAHRCGYSDDLLAYCREHEVCHMLVEEALHDRSSRILWGLAHDAPLPPHEAAYEEMMAQALQRFVRAAERPIIGGIYWDAIRALTLSKLGERPWKKSL